MDGSDFDCQDLAVCGGSEGGETEPENTEEACSDGISNDGDPYVDRDDFDCDDTAVCGGAGEGEGRRSQNTEEACSDGISNDGDQYIDRDDFDCDDTAVVVAQAKVEADRAREHRRGLLRRNQQRRGPVHRLR